MKQKGQVHGSVAVLPQICTGIDNLQGPVLMRWCCLIFSCFFDDDPVDVGILISGFSAFSKSSLNIWKFSVHILMKPRLENFEHDFSR